MTAPCRLTGRRPAWPLVSALPPLAPLPSVPAVARAHLGITCTSWQLYSLAEDAQAIVSELAANAVQASAGPHGNPGHSEAGQAPLVGLRLFSDGRTLLIEVCDQAPGTPLPRHPDADAENGRGLLLVAALARQWGWNKVPGGKVVWATMSA